MGDTIKVFVGGQEEHRLPLKVLEFSIKRHTADPAAVEVIPLRDVEERMGGIPLPRDPKNWPATSFSLQRFLPPAACGYKGRAIYLDSDMILRADIRELWETDMRGASVMTPPGWQSAVMLIDCERARWDVPQFVREMDEDIRSMGTTMNLKGNGFELLRRGLSPLWNCIDRPHLDRMLQPGAKLLHYTDMQNQPWLCARHPFMGVWLEELHRALEAGAVTRFDLKHEIEARHVRPSLAAVMGAEQPYADTQFRYPNDLRMRALKRKMGVKS